MNAFKTAVKVFLFMTVLTGLIYPLLITGIAQLTMPRLANGSLIQKGDQTLGSALIAQNTKEDRYFWPRPSAVDYDPPSGGSNLGPTSQKLKEAIQERKQKIGDQAPPELLCASGSGLDPHINLETAYFQIPRVAKARSMNEADLKNLIDHLSEGKQLGFLGARYVNVLSLNLALDERK
jgi:K+-transporting ATPase ATPase C chain